LPPDIINTSAVRQYPPLTDRLARQIAFLHRLKYAEINISSREDNTIIQEIIEEYRLNELQLGPPRQTTVPVNYETLRTSATAAVAAEAERLHEALQETEERMRVYRLFLSMCDTHDHNVRMAQTSHV
jgi:hypothetical protein